MSILLFFSITNFSSSNISDQETTIDRFFSQDEKVKTYSSSSSDQRLGSLEEGFTLIKENYFLFGPGIFMYNYVWEKHNFYVFPHNTFVYLYSMFGILSLFPFYILIVLPFRHIKFSTAKKLLFELKIRSLIYDDIYQHYEQNIFYCQNNKYEQFYESYFLKFLYHFYNDEMIRGLTKYDKSFYMSFLEEIKQKETLDKEIKYFIDEYDKFLIREKERIEEENTEEYKQKRELEKLEAELKNKQKVDAYSKYLISVMK